MQLRIAKESPPRARSISARTLPDSCCVNGLCDEVNFLTYDVTRRIYCSATRQGQGQYLTVEPSGQESIDVERHAQRPQIHQVAKGAMFFWNLRRQLRGRWAAFLRRAIAGVMTTGARHDVKANPQARQRRARHLCPGKVQQRCGSGRKQNLADQGDTRLVV